MSKKAPPRSRDRIRGKHFAIVASQFNAEYVEGLIDHLTTELRELSPDSSTSLIRVPGAFEIPVVVRELASKKKGDAIIAVGVILKGETDHAQNLSRSVTAALQQIALDSGVPIINVVLSFEDEQQAHERCLGKKINRGTEAARAALEITKVMAKLRSKTHG